VKNPELFAALKQVQTDRAALDRDLVAAMVDAAAEATPVAPRGILVPLPLRLDGACEFTLEPGDQVTLQAPVVSYASYWLVGFRVIADAPIPTAVQVDDFMIGGGCNLLFADEWTPIEAYRAAPAPIPLRYPRQCVRPPNSAAMRLRYIAHPHPTGKTGIQPPVRFSVVIDVEVAEDEVMGWKLSSNAWNGVKIP